jgi:Trypsin-co-occurring domain 1
MQAQIRRICVKQLITVDIGDGTNILVEVDQPASDDLLDIGITETVQAAKETLTTSVEKILPVATMVIKTLRSLPSTPDEVEVSFGFNLSSQAGAFIASCGAQANFGVVLKWGKSTSE